MSGTWDMSRASKKGSPVGPPSPPPVADAAEEYHNHHHHDYHQQPPVLLRSSCDRQRLSSLQLCSAPSLLLVVAAGILICCLEFRTHDERTSRVRTSRVLVPSRCDPRQNPERGHLRGCNLRRSLLRNPTEIIALRGFQNLKGIYI